MQRDPAVRLATDGACAGDPGPGRGACIPALGTHVWRLSREELNRLANFLHALSLST